jgi:hypothetical protein
MSLSHAHSQDGKANRHQDGLTKTDVTARSSETGHVMTKIDLNGGDVVRGSPERAVIGKTEEQAARYHAPLPPKPPKHPTIHTIRGDVQERLDELQPILHEQKVIMHLLGAIRRALNDLT